MNQLIIKRSTCFEHINTSALPPLQGLPGEQGPQGAKGNRGDQVRNLAIWPFCNLCKCFCLYFIQFKYLSRHSYQVRERKIVNLSCNCRNFKKCMVSNWNKNAWNYSKSEMWELVNQLQPIPTGYKRCFKVGHGSYSGCQRRLYVLTVRPRELRLVIQHHQAARLTMSCTIHNSQFLIVFLHLPHCAIFVNFFL